MTLFWRELVPAEHYVAGIEVSQFAPRGDELRAAASGETVLAPLPYLSVIRCVGNDASNFLHNQLTSDINHLKIGNAQHSAWCNSKGRMLASFIVVRDSQGFALFCSADLAADLMQRLQRFVLHSKVVLTNLSETHLVAGIAGQNALGSLVAAGLPAASAPLQVAEFANGLSVCLDPNRFLLVIAADEVRNSWNALATQARTVGTPVWRWLDVQAALPLITAATSEEFVPQMANFDALGGISFHKGCYPGQEVVARTQYLGKVKRHLYRVRGQSPLKVGDALYGETENEQACGMIVVAAPSPDGGYVALAVLQESVTSGEIRVGNNAGAAKLDSLTLVVN